MFKLWSLIKREEKDQKCEHPTPVPSLEVVYGLLHSLLIVADHVLVHVGVVGADILLGAAVGHRAEAQRGVLLRWLLELREGRRRFC